jgi:hypothetical protein
MKIWSDDFLPWLWSVGVLNMNLEYEFQQNLSWSIYMYICTMLDRVGMWTFFFLSWPSCNESGVAAACLSGLVCLVAPCCPSASYQMALMACLKVLIKSTYPVVDECYVDNVTSSSDHLGSEWVPKLPQWQQVVVICTCHISGAWYFCLSRS